MFKVSCPFHLSMSESCSTRPPPSSSHSMICGPLTRLHFVMFEFWKSSRYATPNAPTAVYVLHGLQTVFVVAALPIGILNIVWFFQIGPEALLITPYVLASFSNALVLGLERDATVLALLSKQKYLRLQFWKLFWTAFFFFPLAAVLIASSSAREVVNVDDGFWEVILTVYACHWYVLRPKRSFKYANKVEQAPCHCWTCLRSFLVPETIKSRRRSPKYERASPTCKKP